MRRRGAPTQHTVAYGYRGGIGIKLSARILERRRASARLLDNSPGGPAGQDVAGFLLGLPTGGAMVRSAGGYAANDVSGPIHPVTILKAVSFQKEADN